MTSLPKGPIAPPGETRSSVAPRTAIIIPTWNGQALLSRCLAALATQTCQDFYVVVVDNGSTDDTVAWIQQTYPDLQVIALGRNLGFGAACNAGIRATTTELIVTLNNDAAPQPDFVAHLLRAVDQFPAVGMFAAALWLDRDPPVVDAAGLEMNRLGVAWNLAHGQPVSDLPVAPRLVFGPCAGAALYRRQLLEDVGLFDEAYFAYLEDAELAWRAQWAGWQCMSVPEAAVWHIHSATGGRNLPRKYWLLGRNRLWTILRHYPRPHFWFHLPLIVLNELITGLLAMAVLRHPAPVAGRLDALRTWRTATRPAFPLTRRVSSSDVLDLLSPIPGPSRLFKRYASARQTLSKPAPEDPPSGRGRRA